MLWRQTLRFSLYLPILAAAAAGMLLILWSPWSNEPKEVSALVVNGWLEDHPFDMRDFWHSQGYRILDSDTSIEQWEDMLGSQWVQWSMDIVDMALIPLAFDHDLEAALEELVDSMAEQGFQVNLSHSEESYTVAAQSQVPGMAEEVTTGIWNFSLITAGSFAEGELRMSPDDAGDEVLLAVVIDDWGYPSMAVDMLLEFPLPLTQAILPYLPLSERVAREAPQWGHEIILHQPMEPFNTSLDMGPGGITTTMSAAAIRRQLEENVDHLMGVAGINNHMGSKATSDRQTMERVFHVLQDMDLYFLDSKTTPDTVTRQVAGTIPIPFAENRLFLDNENDVPYIRNQIQQAIDLTQARGDTVVIGHVRPRTARALWDMLPSILETNVRLVHLSEVLEYPEAARPEPQDDDDIEMFHAAKTDEEAGY